MTRKTPADYAAAVRRLKGRFPALALLSRRTKNFTRGEKQAISIAEKTADIMSRHTTSERAELIENGELPAYFRHYKFPRDRRPSDKKLKQTARDLLPFATPETKETLRKIIRVKGKLTPAQRGVVTKKRKAIPYTKEIIPLDKKIADQLPPLAVRGRGRKRGTLEEKPGAGVYGIKLRGHDPKTIRKLRIKNKVLMFEEKEIGPGAKVRQYLYIPIDFDLREGQEKFQKRFKSEADYWFAKGAHSVTIWTVNGAVSGSYGSTRLFTNDLTARYFAYLSEDENLEPVSLDDYDPAQNWILGIVVLIRK